VKVSSDQIGRNGFETEKSTRDRRHVNVKDKLLRQRWERDCQATATEQNEKQHWNNL
jgi:hypothetical protein